MKNKKTLGLILFIGGTLLSALTLLLIPIPAIGLYFLLKEYQPGMNNILRIVLAVIGAVVVVMAIATVVSFMLY